MPEQATAPKLETGKLDDELWREYDFEGRVYRIEQPAAVYWRHGDSTHRVVDQLGVVHCVPAPGARGCVLRWKTRDGADPVQW